MSAAAARCPGARGLLARVQRLRAEKESGSVTVLILGLFVLVGVLVIGAINITAVHLNRNSMMDAADATALHAASALADGGAYREGLGHTLPLSDEDVRAVARADLARREKPEGVVEWAVDPASGSPDGRTAVVIITGRIAIPIGSGMLEALGGSVDVRVVSSARAATR